MFEEDYVAVVSLHDLGFRHDIIGVAHVACAACRIVLEQMCDKDKAGTEAYYHRLHQKCRGLDSKLQLDTSTDLSSQPAWRQYCKECLNLVVLRKILYGGNFNWTQFTAPELNSHMDRFRQMVNKETDLELTYILQLDAVVGRDRVIARTGQQTLDAIDFVCEAVRRKSSTNTVVSDYYHLLTYCRDMDKIVDDSWEHRPGKFTDWQAFCDCCHIALLYLVVLHSVDFIIHKTQPEKDINLISGCSGHTNQDDGQHVTLPAATLAQRSLGTSDALPITLVNNLSIGDGSSSSSSSSSSSRSTPAQSNDATTSDAALPHAPYLCLVRDQLVHVVDESRMNLAGKDGKTWEPQLPNFIVCQLQPHHKMCLDVSYVLPDHKGVFLAPISIVLEIQEVGSKMIAGLKRNKIEDLADEYLELLSTGNLHQLECQEEIGIAGAKDRLNEYKTTAVLVFWLRQYLYGKPFYVSFPAEAVPEFAPICSKHGITIE